MFRVGGFAMSMVLLAACGDEPRAGVDFPSALPRPNFTLTAMDGSRIDFHDATRGHPTLVLFGFTSCPDVCPAHMASIAGAVRQLAEADRRRLRVVFITADPERDTPDRLTGWLHGFDSTFVGLTGSVEDLERAASAMSVPAPFRYTDSGGRVVVMHYERVLGITADDSVRVLIPSGIEVALWTRELRRLVRRRLRRTRATQKRPYPNEPTPFSDRAFDRVVAHHMLPFAHAPPLSS